MDTFMVLSGSTKPSGLFWHCSQILRTISTLSFLTWSESWLWVSGDVTKRCRCLITVIFIFRQFLPRVKGLLNTIPFPWEMFEKDLNCGLPSKTFCFPSASLIDFASFKTSTSTVPSLMRNTGPYLKKYTINDADMQKNAYVEKRLTQSLWHD